MHCRKTCCSYTDLEEIQESDGDLGAIKHSVILIDCTCTWLLKNKVVKKSRWCGWFGSYHIDRLLKSNREQIGGISFEEPCSPARHRMRYHRYSHMHNQCDACGIIIACNCNRKPTLLDIFQFYYCLLQFVWRCFVPRTKKWSTAYFHLLLEIDWPAVKQDDLWCTAITKYLGL